MLKFIGTTSDDNISHAVSFALRNDTFCYVNRGFGAKFLGIRIFNLTKQNLEQIKQLTQNEPNIFKIEEYLDTLTPALAIPMKKQKSGNCSFIACKTMYWFAIYLETLEHLEQNQPSLKNKEQIAAKFAKNMYKYFSTQVRIYSLDNYLQAYYNLDKDYKLLAKVYFKVLKDKRDDLSVNALVTKIDQQTLLRLHEEIVPLLIEYFSEKNNRFYDTKQAQAIIDLINKEDEGIKVTPEQRQSIITAALTKVIQSPNEKILHENLNLFSSSFKDWEPLKLKTSNIDTKEESEFFREYMNNPNNEIYLQQFRSVFDEDITTDKYNNPKQKQPKSSPKNF
jgi:hypothetical protein